MGSIGRRQGQKAGPTPPLTDWRATFLYASKPSQSVRRRVLDFSSPFRRLCIVSPLTQTGAECNVIETHEHKGDFKRPRSIALISLRSLPRSEDELRDLIAAVLAEPLIAFSAVKN